MEFEFDIEDIFHQDQEGFVVLTGKELSSWKGFSSYTAGVKFEQGRKLFDKRNLDPFDKIAIVLDRIGAASSAVSELTHLGTRDSADHHNHGEIRWIRSKDLFEVGFWKNRRDAQSWQERTILQRSDGEVYIYVSFMRLRFL